MNKILFCLCGLTSISTISVFSQIKIAEMPKKEKKEIIFTYDSLNNVESMKEAEPIDRFKHMIGQKIMSISSADYPAFIKYSGVNNYIRNRESLEKIDNKTFSIDNVSKSTFYLSEENNPHNTVILSVDSDHEWMVDYAWVSLGYYEKIKQLYLGKELVYIQEDSDFIIWHDFHDRFMDYNTKRNLAKKYLVIVSGSALIY